MPCSLYDVWKWSLNWGLPINPTKCNYYIAFWRAPPLQLSFATGSRGDSIQVASVHCREAVSKPRHVLFMIMRSFAELSESAFAPLYYALVRHHLEYAMHTCSPNLVVDTDCLEQSQLLTTRLVKGFSRLPYEGRLRWLSLHSLNKRHVRGDLIQCRIQYVSWRIGSGPRPHTKLRQCSAGC